MSAEYIDSGYCVRLQCILIQDNVCVCSVYCFIIMGVPAEYIDSG